MYQRRHTYLDGWRLFPGSCAAHHAQGLGCGAAVGSGEWELAVAATLYTLGYIGYQFGSAVRKYLNGGVWDSPGWDIVDLTAPALLATFATWAGLLFL